MSSENTKGDPWENLNFELAKKKHKISTFKTLEAYSMYNSL